MSLKVRKGGRTRTCGVRLGRAWSEVEELSIKCEVQSKCINVRAQVHFNLRVNDDLAAFIAVWVILDKAYSKTIYVHKFFIAGPCVLEQGQKLQPNHIGNKKITSFEIV